MNTTGATLCWNKQNVYLKDTGSDSKGRSRNTGTGEERCDGRGDRERAADKAGGLREAAVV